MFYYSGGIKKIKLRREYEFVLRVVFMTVFTVNLTVLNTLGKKEPCLLATFSVKFSVAF